MSSLVFRAPKIALMSGSLREGSFNTKLIGAAQKAMQGLGAETHLVNLTDFNLPLYHRDLEAASGLPDQAVALKQVLGESDAWIVASPEYNGFPPPLLVNAYTWCSRGDEANVMYGTFSGKTALVMGASPGAMGGLRAVNPHRTLLQNLGVNVLSNTVAIGGAFKAFDDETGDLVDSKQKTILQSAVETLYYKVRDEVNRENTCDLIERHLAGAGDYGETSTPQSA